MIESTDEQHSDQQTDRSFIQDRKGACRLDSEIEKARKEQANKNKTLGLPHL